MAFPFLAGALIPAAAQAVFGTWQTLNAIKQARRNVRPTYQIDPAFQQNIDLLKSTMGLPASALELYYNRTGQGTSQGIDAILASGGNPNQIAGLLNNQNRSFQDIAIQDALTRKQDLGNVINAQLMLAGERDKAFQINEFAPFNDRAQALSAQKAAGWQNIGGAINNASAMIAANETNKLADSIYGSDGTGIPSPTTPNSGVNVNKLYQELYPIPAMGQNQNALGMFNPNQLSLSNIPQANQINFSQPLPFNPYNQNLFFGNQQPMNLSMFNPSQLSLYNNPYGVQF